MAQKLEESIGAVIVYELPSLVRSQVSDHKTSNQQFLLLKNPNGDWNFTKGHKENGETDHDTIKREIFEETGITSYNILAYIGKIKYTFTNHNRCEIKKQVKFYYIITNTYHVELSNEHVDYRWLGYDENY